MSAVIETKPKLRKLSAITKQVKAFKKTYDTKPDCSTPDGYKEAKEKANELKALRVEAEKARKAEKAAHLAAGAAVDTENKAIVAYIEPREAKYKEAFTAVDDEKKRIKQAEIDAQVELAAAMQKRFDDLDNLALDSHELPEVIAAIEKLDTLDLQPFQDRAEEAATKAEKLLEILNRRKDRLQTEADAAAVVEQQRIENEKAAEQLAADQKKQAEAQAEQQRKLDEQAAQQQREADERAAALKAQEDEIAAKQKALDDKERERRIKADADKKAERDKKAAVEAERIATEKRIADEQAEAERKAEAEKAEAERVAANKPDAEKLRVWFDELNDATRGFIPAVSTDDGKGVRADIVGSFEIFLQDIEPLIQSLESKKAA